MSLQFNVSQLLKAGVGQTREYEFESEAPIDLEDGVASDIKGHVKFTLTNFGIIAAGSASARLDLSCARCLEPFHAPTEIAFEEEFRPSIDITTGLPSSMPMNDTAFLISQNHTIDLEEAVRQHLVLAVELIPLCGQNCRGLCAECGANRNLTDCGCTPDRGSSPFSVLESLFPDSRIESGSPKRD